MLLLIFLLTAIGVYLILSLRDAKIRETVEDRLRRLVKQRKDLEVLANSTLPEELDGEAHAPEARSVGMAARDALIGIVERATRGRKFSNRLQVRLQRADWRWKPAEFLIAQAIAAGLGLGAGLFFAPALWPLLMVFGWLLPNLLLSRSERQRLRAFDSQLPDGLAIISNAIKSGYSFLQALEVVSREMPDPISKEFGLVLRESRVNIPLEESLGHLVERIRSNDLDLVVTAIQIQRQVGGNMSEVLEKISETIKERIKLQGEIRTLTAQGRFSGWIVSLLPMGLVVLMQVVSPGMFNPMLKHPMGWMLIGIAITMLGIGVLMIRNMINLEV